MFFNKTFILLHMEHQTISYFEHLLFSWSSNFLIYQLSFSLLWLLDLLPSTSYNQWQKLWENTAIWTILCFYSLPPLNNVEKQWVKLASSYLICSQHCIKGEGKFLNTFFKIPIIFCHWLSEIYKKKRDEVLFMLFQMTPVCFNKSDYVTLHSMMNIMI